jgi:hypothetical protein
MPDEVLLVLEKVEKEQKAALVDSFYAHSLPHSWPHSSGRSAAPSTASPAINTLTIGGLETPAQSVSVHQSAPLNGTDSTVGHHTGGLPFTPSSILPARPNLPDDPVIPHNGFATVEEGEKAFVHLLKKAGVDANWTWDQTMRAIITDPLYKALNTLGEKKAAWQRVGSAPRPTHLLTADLYFAVYRFTESKRARGEREQTVKVAPRAPKHAQGKPECLPLHNVHDCRQALRSTPNLATG